jgi:cellulose synthase/poly-beta-1,6-N-acetylglucosamine synthase-like glycosyltransferase
MMLPEVVRVPLLMAMWFLAAVWVLRLLQAFFGIRKMIDLTETDRSRLPSLQGDPMPHLSVVVPARDEVGSIEATLRSLFAQAQIRLQIIAVDDRSTDGTSEKMEALIAESAATPHLYEVVHIRELPAGWLGKPHALAVGIERATAPWLLFTDGDVLFAPEALHLALRMAMREKADHLVLAPTLIVNSAGERAVEATIQILGHFAARLWKIGDPKARDAFGVGGFSLVRREALAVIGGWSACAWKWWRTWAWGGSSSARRACTRRWCWALIWCDSAGSRAHSGS